LIDFILRGGQGNMQDVENLIKTSLTEIQKVLNGKTVVGEPIVFDGTTIIPLTSIGFGFGAAGVEAKRDANQKGETFDGGGGGGAGGAGIKPVAVIIISKNGDVSVEPVGSGLGSTLERIIDKIPPAMDKYFTLLKDRSRPNDRKES
jgi:uncharacterized spore protein YtfJ